MRRTRPERVNRRGFTLIEFVLTIVLVGIIVAATVYFTYPVLQTVDIEARAELTDIADNALQRIGREVRLALPNSVRATNVAGVQFVEFLPIRTAGRYRAEAGSVSAGSDCPADGVAAPAADQLSFDVSDTCFKTIGPVVDVASITTNDFLVFNNYGFGSQNAYATAAPLNRIKISTVTDEGTRVRFSFVGTALDRSLHDSPGKRFFVVIGNGTTPEPVSYVCDPSSKTVVRRWGYTMSPTQPTSFTNGLSAQIASDVTGCNFDYLPSVAPQIGLLTLRLTLSRAVSTGIETVSLYHSVHVSNVP
jgi:MSHA biogenesis protein MshO